MASNRQIVITGMGVVSPIGVGTEAYWDALEQGRSGVDWIPQWQAFELPLKFGGVVKDFDPKQHVRPRKSIKVMCHQVQLAFAASAEACKQAALSSDTVAPERIGSVLGGETFCADWEEFGDAYRACMEDGEFEPERWGEQMMKQVFPLWMLKYLPNMPACHAAIALDARGPNNTIVQGDVSPLLSVMESVQVLNRGWADVMIAGGVGSRVGTVWHLYRGFDDANLTAVEPAQACRPFDAGRSGRVWGEGAACFILESREHAEARGAAPLATVEGWASVHRGAQPMESAVRRVIEQAMKVAGRSVGELGHVNAHGASDVPTDRIEAQAIRASLGETPVTAPSSFFGGLGAGGGAVEMAASVLGLGHQRTPITLNYQAADPECPVNVVHASPAPLNEPAVLKIKMTEFGQAAALVLGRPG